MLQETEVAPAVLNIMRCDIEAAFVPDARLPYFLGADKTAAFGQADELDFAAGRMAYGIEEGRAEASFHPINEVGYRLAPNPADSRYLVLYRREEHFVDDVPARGGVLVELFDRVKTLSFQYWDGEHWRDSWDTRQSKGALPEAVKVVLTMAAEPPKPGGEPPVSTHSIVVPLAVGE
jgi:hypothetical protein